MAGSAGGAGQGDVSDETEWRGRQAGQAKIAAAAAEAEAKVREKI
jgi:hypothetical protein